MPAGAARQPVVEAAETTEETLLLEPSGRWAALDGQLIRRALR